MKGKETWPDGSYYKGGFKAGKKSGFGKFIWADNSYYEGQFQENLIDGKGLFLLFNLIKENTFGLTEEYTMANGKKVKCTVKVFLHGQMGKNMSVVLQMIKKKVTGHMNGILSQ